MPQRFLKPGIISSKGWDSQSWAAQSFYIRILTLVDDFGRYEADPVLLKSQAFPLREDLTSAQVKEMCQSLHAANLVIFYEVDGKPYLQVTKWTERARSARSKYPDPPIPQDSAADRSVSLPPKSSSSPVVIDHTSSPPSSAAPGSGRGDFPVEPPPGFPETESAALGGAVNLGCPPEFIIKTWELAVSRGGRDSKDIPIRKWSAYVSTQWKYERERLDRDKKRAAASGKPQPEQKSGIRKEIDRLVKGKV